MVLYNVICSVLDYSNQPISLPGVSVVRVITYIAPKQGVVRKMHIILFINGKALINSSTVFFILSHRNSSCVT